MATTVHSAVFSRETIIELLDENGLTAWFQPIMSRRTGEVFGYEALARLRDPDRPGVDVAALFQKAQAEGLVSPLDMLCRENAFCRAAELGLVALDAFLYVNICPGTLLHPRQWGEVTDELAAACGINKERIILEITEQAAIYNYDLFRQSVEHYRERGYKVAIDDFGAGYGGLKMLSIIKPDYVKVDRHFITAVDQDPFKYNLVDAIATVCHKLGITVIAEGIERPEELETAARFDIDLLQGYLLGRPAPELMRPRVSPVVSVREEVSCPDSVESCAIGSTVRYVEPLAPGQLLMEAFQRFLGDPDLHGIPVVEEDRVVGMLNRTDFLEKELVGPCGYGFALSAHRCIREVLGGEYLLVEGATPVEEVVRRIRARQGRHLYDDVCVARNGRYLGTVAIHALLDIITQKSIQLAKGANPLSGLPGNEFIQRTITHLIRQKVGFDVCYLDIDDFKPYNDYYGFEKGDQVIRRLGELVVEIVQPQGNDRFRFVGHIGGDDFIVVTRPQASMAICQRILAAFAALLPEFHGQGELGQGYYLATDRQGELRRFPLLSLSIGIVSTEESPVHSYGELAFLASGVKRAAKQEKGSAVVRNRRAFAATAATVARDKAA
ncbi:MAG: bifunctional diguanylate cyclase/phosphodiesterase [Thermodesulfobacteriota bacterium]